MIGEDNLNLVGRAVLQHADYRVFDLLGVLVILAAIMVHRRRNGVWPERDDVVRAAIGILMISTAATVFCVFFLTKPPYIEALSSEGLGVSAFITFIFMCGLGISEVKRLFDKRPAEPKGNNESAGGSLPDAATPPAGSAPKQKNVQ